MQITGITNANPAVVTCENVPATLANGDKVLIQNVNGMTEVNDIYFTVAGVVAGAGGTFQLSGINSSAYGAYTSGGIAQEYAAGTFQLAGINSTAYGAYTSGGTAQETKFGTANNHPACGGFFEQRLVLASTNNNPQVISLSKTNDYENWTLGADDDDAIEYTLVSKMIERIRWIVGEKMMLIGTTGGI